MKCNSKMLALAVYIGLFSGTLLVAGKNRKPRRRDRLKAAAQETFFGRTLFDVIERNDSKALKAFIANGANINSRTREGQTPLHLAAQNGNTDMVRYLLEQGVNYNATDHLENRPLEVAAIKGYGKIILLLLDKMDTATHAKRLHQAIYSRSYLTIQRLLLMGESVNEPDKHGNTPLHLAATMGIAIFTKLLIDKGASIDAKNDQGYTPLHKALEKGFVTIASLLLAKNASVDTADHEGNTSLHIAAMKGSPGLISLLIEKGALLNKPNSNGNTPLHTAVISKHANAVRVLLEAGACINSINSAGNAPLHVAVARNDVAITALLVEHYPYIQNAQNAGGATPLSLSFVHRNAALTSLLISRLNLCRLVPYAMSLWKQGYIQQSFLSLPYQHIPYIARKLVRQERCNRWTIKLLITLSRRRACHKSIRKATRQVLLHAGLTTTELKILLRTQKNDPVSLESFQDATVADIVLLPTSLTHPTAYLIKTMKDFHRYGNRNDPLNRKPIPPWFFELLLEKA